MRADSQLPIALFDSGVGGLTVLKAISQLLPGENLLYLGDTARVPYGTKSRDTIERYTLQAAGKLVDRGAKMIVIACNTATSAALPVLREKLAPVPVLGVVEPGARAAAAASKNRHIAVIATEATIFGHAYQQAIGRLLPDSRVVARACTLLVPLAEEGWLDGEVAEHVARRYIGDIFSGPEKGRPDTLLLGCTHFPLFRKILQKIAGARVSIVDSASATASCVRDELAAQQLLNQSGAPGRHEFLTTDNLERFARTGSLFLGEALSGSMVELVDL